MKFRVYIETSVISYLTANPTVNIITAAKQAITREWWTDQKMGYDIFASRLVIEEAGRGDKEAAQKRLNALENIPLLGLSETAAAIAEKLLERGLLPTNANDDALHIAIAATHGMDFLLTWNFRHLDNAETKPGIRAFFTLEGLTCPEMCTPQELMRREP